MDANQSLLQLLLIVSLPHTYILIDITTYEVSVYLGHDQHDQSRPAGEGVRPQPSTVSIVVLLPEVAGRVIAPQQSSQQIRPKLGVDPAGFLPA